MFKPNYILVTLSFLLLYQLAIGQSYIYNSNDVSVADGLLSSRISAIHQDKDGFVWLRTLDGVGRYDGHSFKL